MTDKGSIPAGPSEQYLRLLKGEISAKDYAISVKRRVDSRPSGDESPQPAKTSVHRKKA